MSFPEFYKKTPKDSFKLVLLKSTLIIGTVLLGIAGFRFFFNWLAFENYSKQDIFQKLRSSKEQEKLLVAREWLRHLEKGNLDWRPVSEETVYILAELDSLPPRAEFGDPDYAATLAAIVGHSQFERSLSRKRLLAVLVALKSKDAFLYLQQMGILSLARLGPLESLSEETFFLESSRSHEPSLRKIFAFASGKLLSKSPGVFQNSLKTRLRDLLSDENEEVRWNAAFSLASAGDLVAATEIAKLLDRADSAGRAGSEVITESNFLIFVEALRAGSNLGEMKLRDKIYKISNEHPHLKLRQAAKNFVKIQKEGFR